jgi:hypothetical protein
MSRLPHYLDNWVTDDSTFVNHMRRSIFTLQEDSLYSFLLEPVDSRMLEGLGHLKIAVTSSVTFQLVA